MKALQLHIADAFLRQLFSCNGTLRKNLHLDLAPQADRDLYQHPQFPEQSVLDHYAGRAEKRDRAGSFPQADCSDLPFSSVWISHPTMTNRYRFGSCSCGAAKIWTAYPKDSSTDQCLVLCYLHELARKSGDGCFAALERPVRRLHHPMQISALDFEKAQGLSRSSAVAGVDLIAAEPLCGLKEVLAIVAEGDLGCSHTMADLVVVAASRGIDNKVGLD